MTVAIVPTMNPFKNFPTKKTAFVVAETSTAMAANEIAKAPIKTFFRPNRSARSADMSEEKIAL